MADSGACGSDHSLAGLRVLVTRARHQSAGLVTLIEQHGGTAIRFPVIEILPARDPRTARAAMARLDDFALVIFVSPNAVEHGLAMLDTAHVAQTRAAFAAVGVDLGETRGLFFVLDAGNTRPGTAGVIEVRGLEFCAASRAEPWGWGPAAVIDERGAKRANEE